MWRARRGRTFLAGSCRHVLGSASWSSPATTRPCARPTPIANRSRRCYARPPATGLAPSQASPTPAPPRPASPDRVGGKPTTWVAKAVFGGIARRGQWVVPSEMRVKAVFGGADLDLREARLETDDVVMDVKAVFGGVNIILPDDVIAVVEGTGMFGGFDDQAATRQPPPGSPVVRITGKAVFGGGRGRRKTPGTPRGVGPRAAAAPGNLPS